jgi:glycyl-tRNA synthetase
MSDIKMDDIVSLSKRRGFIFPGSEIYGGEAGLYDFGPYGVELLNNIKKSWWVRNVQLKEDYVGLDSAMFKNPRVWEASGHVGGFSDPLAECKNCNARIRVDKELAAVGVSADEKMSEAELNKLFDEHRSEIACPTCGKKDFSEVKAFNLLVKSNLGDFTGRDERPVYLPGEACQGIYLNFKNIVDSTRMKIPFGIAQIGKAFRNEISPRNFLFRTREFEQADTQFFVRPNENKEAYERNNPDLKQAKEQIPTNENKVQVAVNEQGKTHEATKHTKDPLSPGQSAPKNEKQQKEQNAEEQKPKRKARSVKM